jgi:hypothetical protein
LSYNFDFSDTYFWRNTQLAEIDYLEIKNQEIAAYEIEYNPNQKVKFTKSFTKNYKPVLTKVINSASYWELLL